MEKRVGWAAVLFFIAFGLSASAHAETGKECVNNAYNQGDPVALDACIRAYGYSGDGCDSMAAQFNACDNAEGTWAIHECLAMAFAGSGPPPATCYDPGHFLITQ